MKLIWNRGFNFVGRTGVALFAFVLFIHSSTKNAANTNNAAEVEAIGSAMAVGNDHLLGTDTAGFPLEPLSRLDNNNQLTGVEVNENGDSENE
jgi:predicted neutral ceramidase superfamily lipid hydrolase